MGLQDRLSMPLWSLGQRHLRAPAVAREGCAARLAAACSIPAPSSSPGQVPAPVARSHRQRRAADHRCSACMPLAARAAPAGSQALAMR